MLLDVEFPHEILSRSRWFATAQAKWTGDEWTHLGCVKVCVMKSKAKSSRLRCAQAVSESLSFMYSQALDKIIVLPCSWRWDLTAPTPQLSGQPFPGWETWNPNANYQISTCCNSSQKGLAGIHIHFSLVLKKILFSQLYRHMASPGSSFLQDPLTLEGQHLSEGKEELLTILWGSYGRSNLHLWWWFCCKAALHRPGHSPADPQAEVLSPWPWSSWGCLMVIPLTRPYPGACSWEAFIVPWCLSPIVSQVAGTSIMATLMNSFPFSSMQKPNAFLLFCCML